MIRLPKRYARIVLGAAVLAVVLQATLPTVIVMRGTSMEPTLEAGDVVACTEDVDELEDVEPGDLIAFEYDDRRFVHRVVAIRSEYVATEGDAQPEQREAVPIEDVECIAEPVEIETIPQVIA